MAPGMWHEAEIAYRRERIAADFARTRRASHGRAASTGSGVWLSRWPTLRRLGRGLHVTSA